MKKIKVTRRMLESYVRKLLTEAYRTGLAQDEIYKRIGNIKDRIDNRFNNGANAVVVDGPDAINLNRMINASAGVVGDIGEEVVEKILGKKGVNLNKPTSGEIGSFASGNPGGKSDSAFLGVDVWLPKASGVQKSFSDVEISGNILDFEAVGDFVSMKGSGTSKPDGSARKQPTEMTDRKLVQIAGLILYYWLQDHVKKLNVTASGTSDTSISLQTAAESEVQAIKNGLGGDSVLNYYSQLLGTRNIGAQLAQLEPTELVEKLNDLETERESILTDLANGTSIRFLPPSTPPNPAPTPVSLTKAQISELDAKQELLYKDAMGLIDDFNDEVLMSYGAGEEPRGNSYAGVNFRMFSVLKDVLEVQQIKMSFDAYNLGIIPTATYSPDLQKQPDGILPTDHTGVVYPCYVLDKKVDVPITLTIDLASDRPTFTYSQSNVLVGSSYEYPIAVISAEQPGTEFSLNIEGYKLGEEAPSIRLNDIIILQRQIETKATTLQKVVPAETKTKAKSDRRKSVGFYTKTKEPKSSTSRTVKVPGFDLAMIDRPTADQAAVMDPSGRTIPQSDLSITDLRDISNSLTSAQVSIRQLQVKGPRGFQNNCQELITKLTADSDPLAVLLAEKVRAVSQAHDAVQYEVVSMFLVKVIGEIKSAEYELGSSTSDMIDDTEFRELVTHGGVDYFERNILNIYDFLQGATVANNAHETLQNVVNQLSTIDPNNNVGFVGPMAYAFYKAIVNQVNATSMLLLLTAPKPPGITHAEFKALYNAYTERLSDANVGPKNESRRRINENTVSVEKVVVSELNKMIALCKQMVECAAELEEYYASKITNVIPSSIPGSDKPFLRKDGTPRRQLDLPSAANQPFPEKRELVGESRLYESILLDLMKASAKKQRAAQQPKKIKLTKRQLQELLRRQLK